jgi:hypothetical protein
VSARAGLGTRLRSLWASVRPRTRRGGFLAAAAILAGAAVLSVGLVVGAAMAWNPYVEYSLDRDVYAVRWASLDETFANAGTCAKCHQQQAARATTASHEGMGCQSCHGALSSHVLAGDRADASTVSMALPSDELCLKCHVQTDGRPAGLRQIVPTDHYTADCLACHDPHSGVSNPPPIVEHPLDNLPPCMTCHGPEGFKTRNQRHPVVDTNDKACLSCHLEGRGPREDEASR